MNGQTNLHEISFLSGKRFLAGPVILLAVAAAAAAAEPTAREELIGRPESLVVQPAAITLNGPRAMQQVVVTGRYGGGSVRDLTQVCDLVLEADDVATVVDGGLLQPRRNGTTTLVVKAGEQTTRVPVTVADLDKPQPVSFRHELIAALSVGGCNQGACHGTPNGKNGFRLSLRGYDPAADYVQLTRDAFGRRTDRMAPEASLIYQKALGRMSHEGGQRVQSDSIAAQVMRAWLAEGLRDDPADLPAVAGIEVVPGPRVLSQPARWQQLAVVARFADGSTRDVTHLTVFSSSDEAVAAVSPTGLVRFNRAGEVAVLCRYLDILRPVRFTYLEPRAGFVWFNPPEYNYVDRHVFAKLKVLSIPPSDLCTDAEFIRRAYLDLCAVLPTLDEVRAFLASTDKGKRAKLIDALLERPEFADFWTLKWMDLLRSNRNTIGVKGTHVYQRWLRRHIDSNTPFDRVVRELLTADGDTFVSPPANYYRAVRDPQDLAETTAQLFLGVRMQCARCHNHPFEKWSQDDYYSMAAFFARVQRKTSPAQPVPKVSKNARAEIIYSARAGETTQPRTGKVMVPKVIGMPAPVIPPGKDRREVLADQLTAPENPLFAKSVVNRIWYHLLGRGIVEPVDDFRDSNPSANDELLDALARDFIERGFDVKHIIRTITNSRTYQLSGRANKLNRDDNKYFSHAGLKLMTAEQLLDALCAATEVPEKYPGLPVGTRAVQLPDGEVNRSILKTFGQPGRDLACECEREGDSNLAQALQMINGPTINEKLRQSDNRIGRLLASKRPDTEVLNELFLATLSRPPIEDEVRAALEHVNKAAADNPTDRRKAWEDVHWALLNAQEFLFRH